MAFNPETHPVHTELAIARRRLIGSLVLLVIVVFTLPLFINTEPVAPKRVTVEVVTGPGAITKTEVFPDPEKTGDNKATKIAAPLAPAKTYTLQMGRFPSRGRAEIFRDNFKDHVPAIQIKEVKNKDSVSYIVEVPNLPSEDSAQKLQQDLERLGLTKTQIH